MNKLFLGVFLALISWVDASTPDVTTIAPDLVTPKVTSNDPMPGRRVFQALPGYEASAVRHALYLPTDWIKGETYPVIAEFTGNNGTVAGGAGIRNQRWRGIHLGHAPIRQ